jgi:hypothetical protein
MIFQEISPFSLRQLISGAFQRRGRFGTILNHGMAPPDRPGGIRNHTILTFRNEYYEFGKQIYEMPWILDKLYCLV